MFVQFFGLKFNPFSKEIAFDQLFAGRDLTELESRLKYLQKVRGIGLVVGEPGCGKTTALRKFLSKLNPAVTPLQCIPKSSSPPLTYNA